MLANFNPRSPCGERLFALILPLSIIPFQSTLPVWGATGTGLRKRTRVRFQSTLPVWGATKYEQIIKSHAYISIHAPRVGSDGESRRFECSLPYFNPRSPCGERQDVVWPELRSKVISIHAPRVGSDVQGSAVVMRHINFNPRSPCGERRVTGQNLVAINRFQSTLPVWGATIIICSAFRGRNDFNPRSPCGERRWGSR